MTVRYSMNKEPNWTKALKYMLADLKQALVWANKRSLLNGAQPGAPQLALLGAEGTYVQVMP